MKTLRKFPLFIVWFLVCGCPKQAPPADPAPQPADVEAASPEADLERDCFDGDPAACDQLGH